MPFGGYDTFAACVAANKDKDDPDAYCAAIQRAVEGSYRVVAERLGQQFVLSSPEDVSLLRLDTGTFSRLDPDELMAVLEFDAGWEPFTGDPEAIEAMALLSASMQRRPAFHRRPKRFEARLLSLRDVPPMLNGSSDVARAVIRSWEGGPADVSRHARGLMSALVETVASMGAREVYREVIRQGASPTLLTSSLPSVDVATESMAETVLQDYAHHVASAARGITSRLARRAIHRERRADLQATTLAFLVPGIASRHAKSAMNHAYAYGRQQAMVTLAKAIEIDAVVQSAVMDTHTCDPCAEVDGEVFEYGSARQEELRPPYVKCLGALRDPDGIDNPCRCVQIALLSDGRQLEVDEIDEDALETFE